MSIEHADGKCNWVLLVDPGVVITTVHWVEAVVTLCAISAVSSNQKGVRSGRSEGEEDAAATSSLAASRSPCIDTIHKYSTCQQYNLGIFAPDHSEHEI